MYLQNSRTLLNRDKKTTSESDIEKYAQDNLNIHKKGIFRKKFSVRDMLSWSKVYFFVIKLYSVICYIMCNFVNF